jgi:hypothetical protein
MFTSFFEDMLCDFQGAMTHVLWRVGFSDALAAG